MNINKGGPSSYLPLPSAHPRYAISYHPALVWTRGKFSSMCVRMRIGFEKECWLFVITGNASVEEIYLSVAHSG
ncbi:hypothetical protein TNIN_336891 [Trichonephila inaurata madagascariensis]|uniref:Uncharacterized protein n=1 Tax=Trichonephila inaurata madagascariensis TaxID=2747483 RepID=A0A8X6WLE3_9ARAC|nr:hypothetical protein TNIN_336891 [Trichonephila inaurata madagascariensis]